MSQPVTTIYAWCFSHGRLHHFDSEPWCTATWVVLSGTTEDEAIAVKKERYGEARFMDHLSLDQQVAIIEARRSGTKVGESVARMASRNPEGSERN